MQHLQNKSTNDTCTWQERHLQILTNGQSRCLHDQKSKAGDREVPTFLEKIAEISALVSESRVLREAFVPCVCN